MASAPTYSVSTSCSARTLRAVALFARRSVGAWPQPPRPVIVAMLRELSGQLAALGYRPIALDCGSFFNSNGDNVATITIAVEPGEPTRPLATWYEWQHPRWQWMAPRAAIEGDVATPLLAEAAP